MGWGGQTRKANCSFDIVGGAERKAARALARSLSLRCWVWGFDRLDGGAYTAAALIFIKEGQPESWLYKLGFRIEGSGRARKAKQPQPAVLGLRTTTSQKCAAVPRRAHI